MQRDHIVHIATKPGQMVPSAVPYKFQPIVAIGGDVVFGYEILYRGPAVTDWGSVDREILSFLSDAPRGLPTLFVNLSNESFMQAPAEQIVAASRKNDVFFELSESIAGPDLFEAISAKVNSLTPLGVKFAVDDFGAGHDGLGRTFALDKIAIIKVDGNMMRRAMNHKKNADMLQRVISQWREDGTITVAECIETAEMLAFAQSLQFDMVQGWHVDDLVPPYVPESAEPCAQRTA